MKSSPPIRTYQVHLIALILALSGMLWPSTVSAVQWRPLAQTGRYDVALDKDSVRLTTHGRLAVWLRFMPRGERQRREAAAEYGQKDYRLHLEFFEVDCSELTAVMGLTDILGTEGKRLARLKGNSQPDLITPGSVLDMAAEKVCPALDEAAEDTDEAPETAQESGQTPAPEHQEAKEAQQKIATARQRTATAPEDYDAWVELGNAYYDADLPKQSIEAYNHALELNPNDTNVLNDQGAMYRQTGDFAKALANFEKALTNEPNNLESLYNMGYVYAFDLYRIDRALAAWQRYLKLDSSSEIARQVQSFIERYSGESK